MTAEIGSFGPWLAILVMALASYLCRVSGVVMMGFIPLTPAVRRGLKALPGSIIAATVLPVIERLGPSAGIALGAALLTMILVRNELVTLLVGMGAIAALRALGA